MEKASLLSLPDELLIEVCEHMTLSSLNNFIKSNTRPKQLCENVYQARLIKETNVEMDPGSNVIVYDGKVYFYGVVSGAQLEKSTTQWVQVTYPEPIVKVGYNANYTLALSKNGEVYMVGMWNIDYDWFDRPDVKPVFLNYRPPKTNPIPQLFPFVFPEPIVNISAGTTNTLFVGASGNVYGLGKELLHFPELRTPTVLPLPEPMLDAQIDSNIQLYLGQSGQVYESGIDIWAPSLGFTVDPTTVRRVILPEPALKIQTKSSINSALTQSGSVYIWGRWNRNEYHDQPVLISGDDSIVDYSINNNTVGLVTFKGTVTVIPLIDNANTVTFHPGFQTARIFIEQLVLKGFFLSIDTLVLKGFLLSTDANLYSFDVISGSISIVPLTLK